MKHVLDQNDVLVQLATPCEREALFIPENCYGSDNRTPKCDWIERNQSGIYVHCDALAAAMVNALKISYDERHYYQGEKELKKAEIKSRIKNAIDLVGCKWDGAVNTAEKAVYAIIRPNARQADETPRKKSLTLEDVQKHLADTGRSVSINLVRNEIDITAPNNIDRNFSHLVTKVQSEICDNFKGVNRQVVANYIRYIAQQNARCHQLELINGTTWDGKDRFEDLWKLMHIEQDELSKTLVRKWLFQSYALLGNDGSITPEGMLVLLGKERTCKSTLLEYMSLRRTDHSRNNWYYERCHVEKYRQDPEIQSLRLWIAEFAELDAFLKGDIAPKMKALISASVDIYRPAYAEMTQENPRRTSFAGTTNKIDYLPDMDGSRKFFTVPIKEKMDYSKIINFDFIQLWAQIAKKAKDCAEDANFRLTDEQYNSLVERNESITNRSDCYIAVQSIIEKLNNRQGDANITDRIGVDAWRKQFSDLAYFKRTQVTDALLKLGYEQNAKSAKNKSGKTVSRWFELPVTRYEA